MKKKDNRSKNERQQEKEITLRQGGDCEQVTLAKPLQLKRVSLGARELSHNVVLNKVSVGRGII